MDLFIGCSGFHYKSWNTVFYPEGLPKNEWLTYYAQHFNTVEINNTLYSFPAKKTIKSWYKNTPDDFLFSIKANRYFTHMKKLNIDNNFVVKFKDFNNSIDGLGNKLGAILWQLPGNFKKDEDKLKAFIEFLPNDKQHVIEFRNPTWFTDSVIEILNNSNILFCEISSPQENLPELINSNNNVKYLRFHGKDKWYDYLYSESEMEEFRDKLVEAGIKKIFAYFNNDMNANAIKNGLKFKELLKEKN